MVDFLCDSRSIVFLFFHAFSGMVNVEHVTRFKFRFDKSFLSKRKKKKGKKSEFDKLTVRVDLVRSEDRRREKSESRKVSFTGEREREREEIKFRDGLREDGTVT